MQMKALNPIITEVFARIFIYFRVLLLGSGGGVMPAFIKRIAPNVELQVGA
jgi:hypothetical protein